MAEAQRSIEALTAAAGADKDSAVAALQARPLVHSLLHRALTAGLLLNQASAEDRHNCRDGV